MTTALRIGLASGGVTLLTLLVWDSLRAKDARDRIVSEEIRRLVAEDVRSRGLLPSPASPSAPATPPGTAEPSICAAARDAVARSSPAAPGLVAQCRALGFDVPGAPLRVEPPVTPITPAPPVPPVQPSGPEPIHRLAGTTLNARTGLLYHVTVVVHFPASIKASTSVVSSQAAQNGFTDLTVTKTKPSGWPGASGDYYVTGRYAGEPKSMARSYALGQVQITDVWEGG